MNRAFKYRLYPTTEQRELFMKTFGCCRKVYNLMLAEKIEHYKQTGKFATVTPAKYKKEYPYLKEVDSLALANKQLDLQKAFKNHFDKNRKKNTGFPKFKSAKRSRKSYTTNNQGTTIRLFENGIKLPKVGIVKAKIHRQPEPDWIIKSATVSQDSDGKFYVSVLFEYNEPVCTYVPNTANAIGLDYASNGLYVDDNGNVGTEHKYTLNEMKQKGYTRAMEDNGLTPKYLYTSGDIRKNELFFNEILEREVPEVALVVRDSIAISLMNVATKKGIKVPDTLQVIGFQNTRYAQLSNPKLTCVEIPIYEMGNTAMSYLTNLMKEETNRPKKAEKILLAYDIIWRESTK